MSSKLKFCLWYNLEFVSWNFLILVNFRVPQRTKRIHKIAGWMPDLCDLAIKQFHGSIYERFPLLNILSATKFLEVIRVYLKDANNCEICLCKFATTTLSGSFFYVISK